MRLVVRGVVPRMTVRGRRGGSAAVVVVPRSFPVRNVLATILLIGGRASDAEGALTGTAVGRRRGRQE